MADIAEQAGVSKGTPYLYFPGKEALFLALHEEWDCGVGDRVNAAIAALPEAARRSPRQVLHVIAGAVAAHVLANTETCRVLMQARALAAHEPAIADTVRASGSPAGVGCGGAGEVVDAGELGRYAEHRSRGDRRQPDLEALAIPSAGPQLAREEPGDEAAAPVPSVGIVDDASCLAQVDDQGDGWVRDHGDVHGRGKALAEPGHAAPRQLT